jgi:hypothetical protein
VKNNKPKRWYMVMVFAMALSFFVFMVAPRIGYDTETAHAMAIMIGIWAPTLGIMGVRAEAMQSKDKD